MVEQPDTELDPLHDFDQHPVVARMETDRFCDHCGYNLHTQAVRRDARTQLLLCRCPECGRLHAVRDGATAGRVWLQRLGTLALFSWIGTVLAVGFGLAMGQLGVTIGTLEELTSYRKITVPTPAASQPAASQPAPLTLNSATGTLQITRTISSPPTRWQRQINTDFEYYAEFITFMLGLAFVLGFALAFLMAVTMHHWPRWGYLIPIVLIPLAIGAGVWHFWGNDYPHLRDWSTPYVVWNSAANLVGGVVGVFFARPFARLLVTLILPPRTRQILAFLWLADGKSPPTVVAK